MRSCADLAILPIQDILGFGADCRMNTPGEAEGNWSFRVTGEQIRSIDRYRFSRMNWLYGRLCKGQVETAPVEDEA
jgi:4-alpha-glucanotransferase